MLRSRHPSVRTPFFRPTRYRLNRPAFSLCLPISLSKISSTPVLAHRMLLCHALAAAIFRVGHHILRCAAPLSSAALHPLPCSLQLPAHRAPCPIPPRAEATMTRRRSSPEGCGHYRRRGYYDTRPLQGDVAMKAHVASVCFKCFRCFRGVLQLFHMNVAKVDRGCCTCYICCKCFRGMLQVFQRFVQNVSSVLDVCCKRFDLDIVYVLHICCNNMF
jgi:hypothetical protein